MKGSMHAWHSDWHMSCPKMPQRTQWPALHSASRHQPEGRQQRERDGKGSMHVWHMSRPKMPSRMQWPALHSASFCQVQAAPARQLELCPSVPCMTRR